MDDMRKTKRNIVALGAAVAMLGCALLLAFFYALGKIIRQEVSTAKSTAAVMALREKFLMNKESFVPHAATQMKSNGLPDVQ